MYRASQFVMDRVLSGFDRADSSNLPYDVRFNENALRFCPGKYVESKLNNE